MKKAVLLCGLFLMLIAACKNPMVNYLLGEKDKEEEDPSPVARYGGDWYSSLAEALDAAAAVPDANPVIQIRRDIQTNKTLGAASFTLPYKSTVNNVTLEPYTPDTAFATIRRASGGGPFFTINAGGSLTLKDCAIDGAGALTAVSVTDPTGRLVLEGNGRVETNSAVLLATGAAITPSGVLGAQTAARITPAVYPAPQTPAASPPFHPAHPRSSLDYTRVLDGADITASLNYEKFDVTPERPPSAAWDSPPALTWESPRHWRVDEEGYLIHVVASHVTSGTTIYYETLSGAIGAATGTPLAPDTVTLIANIELGASDNFLIQKFIRLTVPPDCRYIIKRTAATTVPVFTVDYYYYLELGAPGGAFLTIDGGAVWSGGYPTPTNNNTSGINSDAALVKIKGTFNNYDWGKFVLGSDAVLQNNNRNPGGNGGGIEASGYFEIKGGVIRHNRSAENGGGIAMTEKSVDNDELSGQGKISGGEITGNAAAWGGGGIMLHLHGGTALAMTGGSITGNRAGGKDPGGMVEINNAFGGGVFIPHGNGNTRVNTFTMSGGTIAGNISAGGIGNGIAMDILTTAPTFVPKLNLGGSARINDDVCLHNAGVYPWAPLISAAGFSHAPPILVTLDDYTGASSGIQVLTGSYNHHNFTAAALYYLHADGAIWNTP